MTRYSELLTTKGYVLHTGKVSLAQMAPETVFPATFLIRYCGWTNADIKGLTPSQETAFRFGPAGRKMVKGYVLADVLKFERTRAFRDRHAQPLSMTESRLKSDFFFTDGLIRKWLGAPDALMNNPHYKKGAPMRLHRIGKILMLRTLPEVETDLSKIADHRETRSVAARAAAETRRDAWIAEFNKIEVEYNFPKTYADAENAARNREMMSHKKWGSTDVQTRLRWTVNMLRHEFTDYDHILALSLPPGRAGHACYRMVKIRILQKIADVFPQLEEEASRQMYA